MVRHNNIVPNNHFRKHWQNYVKTWFNQPARKLRRRQAREKKAARVFPRPASGLLRPLVQCPTVRYNSKVREGRGFTLEELKAAGIPAKAARSIGISVDHRRTNSSLESLQLNTQRLLTYKSKLIVFPRRSKKPKAGDSSPEELANATQLTGPILPYTKAVPEPEIVKITETMKDVNAYNVISRARNNVKYFGLRQKKAAEAAEKEEKKN